MVDAVGTTKYTYYGGGLKLALPLAIIRLANF